jgi:hypothetical protein
MKGAGRVGIKATEILARASYADHAHTIDNFLSGLSAWLNRDDNSGVAELLEPA